MNENTVKIRFIGSSKNAKTGDISQTYTTCNTCPKRCPFKHNGCYAENFFVKINWNKTEKIGVAPEGLRAVIEQTPHTNIIRHNVAGDIAVPGTDDIDENLVNTLCKAYKGLKAYTYTHTDINNQHNIEIVKKASDRGFIINFSTENVKDALRCRAAGVNAVIAVNTISDKMVVIDNTMFIQCPATYNKDFTCKQCGMCWQKNRKHIIVFPVHGAGQGKAKKAGFLTDL